MAININVQTLVDDITKMSDADSMKLGNLIFAEGFLNPDFKGMHKIIQNVKIGDKIPFADAGHGYDYMKSTKANGSQCDDNVCDTGLVLSSKSWTPGRYNCATEFCYKDLETILLDFFNSDLCSFEEFSTSVFVQYLQTDIGRKLAQSMWTKTYFSEFASTSTYLNGHDGLFVQLEALAAPGSSQRITIAENAQATYALQNALGSTAGFDTFNAMLKARTRAMKKNRTLEIRTTRELAENYQEWLRTEKQVTCCTKDPLTNDYSLETLAIYGTKIVVVDAWDDIINELSDFNNGTKWTNPHRAILIAKDNYPIGTCNDAGFEDARLKKHDYDEKMKIKPEYTFDVKVLRDTEFVFAM